MNLELRIGLWEIPQQMKLVLRLYPAESGTTQMVVSNSLEMIVIFGLLLHLWEVPTPIECILTSMELQFPI